MKVCVYIYVCVCVNVWVGGGGGHYVCVGLFIVLTGYGFGKANLSLGALGPCQLHQPVSYAICYRTTTACIHTCGNKHYPFPSMSTVIHSTLASAVTVCIETSFK